MSKITIKDIVLLVVGGIIFPLITEVITPYLLKELQEPVYSISRQHELFGYDGVKPDNLAMIINDTISVTTDVNLFEIVFWNNGKKEILQKDIRSPFVISPPNGGRFAYLEITDSTEPEISGFSLLKNDVDYEIKWKYFEPNFGFKVQAIVLGDQQELPTISGYVPQNRIKKVELPFEPLHKNEKWFLAISYCLFSSVSIYSLIILIRRKKYSWKYIGTPLIMLLFVIYRTIYFFVYTYHPPDLLY